MKRFLEFVFWIGILCACVPLLMYAFGNARQAQLAHAFTQTSTPAPSDSPGLDTDDGLVRLRIPKMHLDAMIVGDVTDTALAEGPGHFPNSALPGEVGNCAIAAHRNLWGCWFANLDEMKPGDTVILETQKRHFVYKVDSTDTVEPDDSSILNSNGKKKELTLVTCTIPATHRIVVRGTLDHTSST